MIRLYLMMTLLIGCSPLGAQAPPPREQPWMPAGPPRDLSLPDAIHAAVAGNPWVEVERLSIAAAEESAEAARGAFDLRMSFSPQWRDRAQPVSSLLQGGPEGRLEEAFFQAGFGVSKSWRRTGGGVSFRFQNVRQSTSNLFVNLNPLVESEMVVEFRQPLRRNRETDRRRTQLLVSRKNIELSRNAFEQRLTEVVAAVADAYWSLAQARRELELRQESLDLARRQRERTRRMARAGSLAKIETAAAEAELERRRGELFTAGETVARAENRLKALISRGRDSVWWQAEIVPSGGDLPLPPLAPVQDAVETALRRRPELHSLDAREEISDLETRLRREQVKRRLDLVAAYGQTGLAGSARAEENPFSSLNDPLFGRLNELSRRAGLEPISAPPLDAAPAFLLGGYGATLSNLFGKGFRTMQVGIEADLSPRNRAAQAELAKAEIERRQIDARRRQLELEVEAEVRNGLQAIQTARQRVRSARAAVRARQLKLESETRLFEHGESTNFLVLTRQNEYSAARASEAQARAQLNLAVSEYYRGTGELLDVWNVTLR